MPGSANRWMERNNKIMEIWYNGTIWVHGMMVWYEYMVNMVHT